MSVQTRYTARIVAVREITIPVEAEKEITMLRITYNIPNWPPRTIWIDKEKATKENIKSMIEADLERILGRKVSVEVEGI